MIFSRGFREPSCAKKIDKSTETLEEQSEDEIARDIARYIQLHTSASLVAYGKERGCTAADVGPSLKAVNINVFDADKWANMIAAVDVYITEKDLEKLF